MKTPYLAWISLENQDFSCSELELYLGAQITYFNPHTTKHAAAKHHVIMFDIDIPQDAASQEKLLRKIQRLAYTSRVAIIVDSFSLKNPPDHLSKKLSTTSYKVDFFNSMRDLDISVMNAVFGTIFRSMDSPKVDMKSPKTIFCTFIDEQTNIAWIGEELWNNDFAYERRKSHLREVRHSAAMPPKLIRGMINLSGVVDGTICDPFCGTAGILIEAMHCGLNAVGSDIDPKMVAGARKNIRNEIALMAPDTQFRARCDPATDIAKESATVALTKADAIVTDVPYGKNTKKLSNPQLYKDFLMHVANNNLTSRVVICMPHYAHGEQIIPQTTWKLLKKLSLRVHGSLTREIFVLSK